MLQFALRHPDKLLVPLLQHLQITFITLVISFAAAIAVSLLVLRFRRISQAVVGFFSAVYAIPSLALFALLIPVTGLGERTAVVVLVLYNQFILVRNILAGFRSVDASVLEAATGMGMSERQLFFAIRLPLASPVILAGVRIAVVSTIGIATIAATINAGGIGSLLFDGLRTQNTSKLLWGTLLASLLAVAANLLLSWCEKRARRRIAGLPRR